MGKTQKLCSSLELPGQKLVKKNIIDNNHYEFKYVAGRAEYVGGQGAVGSGDGEGGGGGAINRTVGTVLRGLVGRKYFCTEDGAAAAIPVEKTGSGGT